MKDENAATFSDLDEAAPIVWEASRLARSMRLHDGQPACTPLLDRDCRGACGRWVTELTLVAVQRAHAAANGRDGWRRAVVREARRAADDLPVRPVAGARPGDQQRMLQRQLVRAATVESRRGQVPYPVVVRRVAAAAGLEPARVHQLLRDAARRGRGR